MNTPQEPSEMPTEKHGQELLVPRPSYGVLVWAGLLILSVFSAPRVFSIQILCCVISVSACVWWHIISRKRVQRADLLRRIIAVIAFGFGTLMFHSGAMIVLLGLAHKDSAVKTSVLFILSFAVAVGLIAGAYYLVFRRDDKNRAA